MQDKPLADLSFIVLAPAAQSQAALACLLQMMPKAECVWNMAEAQSRLAADQDCRLILLCPHPAIWLAAHVSEGLAQDMPPPQALANWQAQLLALRPGLRANRRRISLIFDSHLLQAPKAVAETIGLEGDGDLCAPSDVPADDAIMTLIAHEMLRQTPAAQILASELEASALPLEGVEPALVHDLERLFDGYKNAGKSADVPAEEPAEDLPPAPDPKLALLTEELELLRAHLRQGEANRQQSLSAGQERIQGLELERKKLQQALQSEHARMQAAEVERDRLGQHTLEAELNKLQQASQEQAQTLGAERKRLQQALLEQQAHGQALAASHQQLQSEAQHYRTMAENNRRQAQEAAQKQVRELQDQLFLANEDLRHKADLQETWEGERLSLRHQIAELHQIREELETYFERSQVLGHERDALQAEMGRIYQSRSYKMVTPLRKLRSHLRSAVAPSDQL